MHDGTPKQFVELTCKKCGNLFQKEKKEYDRQVRKGRKDFYCNLKCAGVTKESKSDAPFKFMWRISRQNSIKRKHDFNLSVKDIEDLWEKQKGKCAYTGIPLISPTYKHLSSPRKASLDRIDSSKGYVKGNIEFVCVFVNLGKNGFNKKEIFDLLQEFKKN
jgi:hypothetical protein